MGDIPRAVLSEHFQERMRGRRIVSAVFLTYQFDPAFFEQEVLPVFLDIPLSHSRDVKLVQLDDALRTLGGNIAVYYDEDGLTVEAQSARLDIKRISVRHRTGVFHPKNVFLLVEDTDPDENGQRALSLLVASMSANLTRAGWWENIEACHIEEIRAGALTMLRDDLVRFISRLERQLRDKSADGHAALRDIREFLRGTEQRTRHFNHGLLCTQFFAGQESLSDFFRSAGGDSLRGMNLEVISPYFDGGDRSLPLSELIERFEPREVRVFLPRNDTGAALCNSELYEWMRSQPGVCWSHLPKDMLRLGKSEDLRQRFVHAKVYRFFTMQPKREVLFIGSANLTTAAHEGGGNLESGFLVEVEPARRPEWWTVPDERRPQSFEVHTEDEGTPARGGTRLSLRYWWDKGTAEVFWDDGSDSPKLSIVAQGVELFVLPELIHRVWTLLPQECSCELGRVLLSTSILSVFGDGDEPGFLLVQEEGMAHRPSLLRDISLADIFKSWALLTVEQRTAFLELRATRLASADDASALMTAHPPMSTTDSLFDRFAGIFHSFGGLERKVRAALRAGNEREATYLIFGQKYDSLGNLLGLIENSDESGQGDPIENYVITLCARQCVGELRREFREFWERHSEDAQRLERLEELSTTIRARIVARDPTEMTPFLDWFERWFLPRATAIQSEGGA